MTSKKVTYINDLKGVEFAAESDVFNNNCYQLPSEQLLPGVRSLKLCGDSSPPLYISFPHFYLADSSYSESICGMNPNQTLHEFKIVLENVCIFFILIILFIYFEFNYLNFKYLPICC